MRFERPVSYAAGWAQRLAFFALLLVVAAGTMHHTGRLETRNFAAIGVLGGALAACALLLSIAGLWSLWVRGARGGRAAFRALLLALLILAPLAWGAVRYHQLPRLYDISTDVVSPPAFVEAPGEASAWWGEAVRRPPEDAALLQRAAYSDLTGRRYEGAIDRVIAAVRLVAGQRGFVMTEAENADMFPETVIELPDTPEITDSIQPEPPDLDSLVPPLPTPAPRGQAGAVAPPSRVVLQGVVSSPGLAIPSDIVIRLIEEEETTFVDMRAVLRTGDHDLGLNAWHISRFFGALDAELHGVAAE